MSTEAIYAKYWAALMDVDAVMVPADTAIALALRLAVQDAYGEGSALAQDLAAIVASQAQPTPDQRQQESLQAQISRLNEWLEKYAPALYHNPDIDTAAAVLMELGVLRRQLSQQIDDHEDLASARQELVTLIAERDGLRQKLAQMDTDNAGLIAEIDRLTRKNVSAVGTLNSLTELHSNGASAGSATVVDPTTTPEWNRNHPAWDGMTDEERIALYELTSGRAKFGELSLAMRTEILARVLRHTMDGAERLTMARFDNRKPEWMPMASGLVKVFGGKWPKLLDLAAAPA